MGDGKDEIFAIYREIDKINTCTKQNGSQFLMVGKGVKNTASFKKSLNEL